jgi:hypothetical protein
MKRTPEFREQFGVVITLEVAMKQLSREQFARARDFLHSQGRPLDRATFELEFESGTVDAVLTELRKFQNPDGGFGQALEPDVRTPSSSALCTEMGLRYLMEWGVPADHPMVQAAVKYLLHSFDAESQVWRVIPEDANDHPHAPWWHDEAGSLARTFDDFLVIPRAGILASLYHYTELIPADWLTAITARTVDDIMALDTEKFGGGGDTLVYALRLMEAPGLATHLKARLEPRLWEAADAIVARDPQAWAGYVAPPLKLAHTPTAPLADLLAGELQAYLDYLVEQQTPEGTWEPTWSWGESYPQDWAQAKQEWRGILTFDTLVSLRAFSRMK